MDIPFITTYPMLDFASTELIARGLGVDDTDKGVVEVGVA